MYEKIRFICKTCNRTFTIKQPLILPRSSYMSGVIKYATHRILKKGDSIRRVTEELNELHKIKVSVSEVKQWVDKIGKRDELNSDFSNEKPPEDFSGFISIDGTFKAATAKKTLSKRGKKGKKSSPTKVGHLLITFFFSDPLYHTFYLNILRLKPRNQAYL